MNTAVDFNDAMIREYNRMVRNNPDVSVWEVFLSMINSAIPPYIVTLRADIDICKAVAQGLSLRSIANTMGIPSRNIAEVAKTWGMVILNETLDFNPLLVYNRGMEAEQLCYRMNEILPIPIGLSICRLVIENIERYHELLDFLKE